VVDAERLRRVLQRVSSDVFDLKRYAAREQSDLLRDVSALGHLKYLFITAVEGCINAAHHIGASEGLEPPGSNAESIRILGRHGFVPNDIAESVAAAVGFRNVLVHQYLVVDDGIVVDHLKRLGDVEEFVAALSALI
jgi:uncharacterized protein YutE (UPF0331/DUF86 family)